MWQHWTQWLKNDIWYVRIPFQGAWGSSPSSTSRSSFLTAWKAAPRVQLSGFQPTHAGDPGFQAPRVPDSWHQCGPALTIAGIGGVNQQMSDIRLCLSNKYNQVNKFFKSRIKIPQLTNAQNQLSLPFYLTLALMLSYTKWSISTIPGEIHKKEN